MIIVHTLVRHNKLWFNKKKKSLQGGGGGGGEGAHLLLANEGQHFVWFGLVASKATFFQSYWDRANAFLLQTGTG